MAPNQDQELNALLAGYAAGTLPPPLSALVAGHLELSPVSRRFVSDLETLSGRAVEEAPPVAIANRDARLAAIFASPAAVTAPKPAKPTGRLPASILRFVGHDVDGIPWKTKLPGLREYKVGDFDGFKTSLFWIGAGRKIPSHTHDGGEVTLVLEGGFSDALGSYERGDISINDASVDHVPVADEDGDCICFAVTDAPLRLTGRFGRLINPFIRG
ncbi:ChrR family anti-sigma-E factor [Oharaeibacter diazotrophicus]|uniref:ChrR-like anti-ECFsigma factor n=1 Tax=Oharaeibacter diazotrophicus TaxID=1920512 RepID=A0A4R6RLU1_9HYPH|nr:ChrR family anti-sigma-E factor [Oharaeibacter diazotrophicus]TDP87095.1 ChrR-like anti-ECFsigma factor [Oharaeibacter diazotrophicus]BBE70962.1 anti-sigma-E factor ChrR [Pleomorphomonas sp. SM30]GLS77711.1 anti-sigma-E factor ChrR [Oharaeibacter diazotrophicus]